MQLNGTGQNGTERGTVFFTSFLSSSHAAGLHKILKFLREGITLLGNSVWEAVSFCLHVDCRDTSYGPARLEVPVNGLLCQSSSALRLGQAAATNKETEFTAFVWDLVHLSLNPVRVLSWLGSTQGV